MASTSVSNLRKRRSINDMCYEWLEARRTNNVKGQRELSNLVRAWEGICNLSRTDPDNEHSFFKIGGFHGEPFRGAGYANADWWGGYCNHGNVLFPTWHRAYCLRIENALRSIKGCSEVTLPYWDETGEDTAKHGVPIIFTMQEFELDDGRKLRNPLYSYQFPQNIIDRVDQDSSKPTYNLYTKHKGYETVRYPYSGLVGTPEAAQASKEHNAKLSPAEASDLLSKNVKDWLDKKMFGSGPNIGTRVKFSRSLEAPNYTVFSNTTSAQAWNDVKEPKDQVISLESPHNDMHLAVGGFDVPGQGDVSPVPGANGDMGENDTAGLDPIFFFHHAEIDRYFWLWQRRTGNLNTLDIIPDYPGTNSVDSQGPTPGVAGGTWLTLDSPLRPFTKPGGHYLTSKDVVNIESQLNYTYEPPKTSAGYSKDPAGNFTRGNVEASIRVTNVHKNQIAGSHIIAAYLNRPGKKEPELIGFESVLSRWNVSGCANCQVSSSGHHYIPLYGLSAEDIRSGNISIDTMQRQYGKEARFVGEPVKPSFQLVVNGRSYLNDNLAA